MKVTCVKIFAHYLGNDITPQIEEDINLVQRELTRPSGRSAGVTGLKSSLSTAALSSEKKKRGHSLIVSEGRGRLYTGYLKSNILNHAH